MPSVAEYWDRLARREAEREGVDPDLYSRLVRQESRYDPDARSPKGASGLAQLMPDTAAELGVDPSDPLDNLRGGARYLKQQVDRFGRELGTAAYNAGPGRVAEYGTVPPFRETQDYVRRVVYGEGEPPRHPSEIRQKPASSIVPRVEDYLRRIPPERLAAPEQPPAPEQAPVPAPEDEFAPFPDPQGMGNEAYFKEHPYQATMLSAVAEGPFGRLGRTIQRGYGQALGDYGGPYREALARAESKYAAAGQAAPNAPVGAQLAAAPISVAQYAPALMTGGGILGAAGAAGLEGAAGEGLRPGATPGEIAQAGGTAAAFTAIPVGVGRAIGGVGGGRVAQGVGGAAINYVMSKLTGATGPQTKAQTLLGGVAGAIPRPRAKAPSLAKTVKEQFREFAATPTPKTAEAMVDVTRPVTERPRAETPTPTPKPRPAPTPAFSKVSSPAMRNANQAASENLQYALAEQKAAGEHGEVVIKQGGATPLHKITLQYPEPTMQGVLTATKASIPRRFLTRMNVARKEAFTYLSPLKGIPELANQKELLRQSQIADSAGAKEAVADLTGIRGGLKGKETALHGIFVRLKDMEWRALHHEDYKLPAGVTLQDVQGAINFYKPQALTNPKIAGANGSLARHLRAVRGFHSDLTARGELDPNAARNPWYFRHEVLDFVPSEKRGQSTKQFFNMLKSPARQYGRSGKSGTERMFEQDYWGVMFRYFKQVRADNIRADYMDAVIKQSNRPDLLGKPARLPELEIVPVPISNFVFKPRVRELYSDVMQQLRDGTLSGNELKEVAKHFNIKPEQLESIRAGKTDFDMVYLPRALADVATNPRHWHINQPEIIKVMQDGTRFIKSVLLNVNPIRYNVGNAIGDTQNLVRDDPMTILAYPRAAKMIIRSAVGEISPEMRIGIEKSVADSGKIGSEVTDPRKLIQFADLMEVKFQDAIAKRQVAKTLKLTGQLWRGLQGLSQGRENIPRMAKFLTDLDRIKAGKQPLNTWSNFDEIKGIMEVDPVNAAAKIAREQLFDYGALTPFEVHYLRNGLIPFYTFFRRNTPRWAKYPFVANSWVREGASPQAKVGRYALSKSAMIAGVASVYSAYYAWNNVKMKEVEDKLYGWQRNQFHINVGLDDKGNPKTFTAASALDDALRVMGLDEVSPDMEAAIKGQKTWKEVFDKWYEDGQMFGIPGAGYAVDAVTERVTPFIKAPATAALGIETFPNPRELRIVPKGDRLRAAARGIGLREPIELAETLQGKRPGQTGETFAKRYLTTVRTSDAGREAYYDLNNNIRNFLRKKGRTQGAGGDEGQLTKVSRAYYKALEAGDMEKARVARDEWKAAAQANKMDFSRSFLQSRSMRDPRAKLGRYYSEWKKQASSRELEQFDRARDYYRKVYLKTVR